MNKGLKIALVNVAAIATVAGVLGVSYINAYNTGNKLEKIVVASHDNARNVLSSTTLKIGKAAQIPEMQRDDLAVVIETALSARYGDDGSKAMFQFIQEQNPQLDSAVYTRLQDIITAGQNDFAIAQTEFLDRKRVYETKLGSFWGGSFMSLAGYPKIDLADYKIVTDVQTEAAFTSGTQEIGKLR